MAKPLILHDDLMFPADPAAWAAARQSYASIKNLPVLSPCAAEAELFNAQALTEAARMSLDDGLVMQTHPDSFRNHSRQVFGRLGRDKGADIPTSTNYLRHLKPLLDWFGAGPAPRRPGGVMLRTPT